MLFTTSWDDGYALDVRVADLLSAHGCTGTFYVCPHGQHGAAMLTEDDIRRIARSHEIGAHTLTHPRLTRVPEVRASEEIQGSKEWVETATGAPCRMFCYPKGDCDARVRGMVETAGFAGARTVEALRFAADDPLDRKSVV